MAAILPCAGLATEITVTNTLQFRQALAQAQPGTVVRLSPGAWPGNQHFSRLRGSASQPIVIAAADPGQPPIFDASSGGLQFSACSHLTLRDIIVTNFSNNGLTRGAPSTCDRQKSKFLSVVS